MIDHLALAVGFRSAARANTWRPKIYDKDGLSSVKYFITQSETRPLYTWYSVGLPRVSTYADPPPPPHKKPKKLSVDQIKARQANERKNW